MADHATKPSPETEAGGSKMFSRLKIAVILVVIVVVQCLLAYIYLPSGSEAKATESAEKAEHEHADAHAPAQHEHADDREVDLGQFSLTAFDAAADSTLLIDFHLYGTVAVEPEPEGHEAEAGGHGGHGDKNAVPEDNSKFGKLFKQNKHRFRDQVIVIIRNAELADLADPGLGLIKRQILAKTNALLGEPLLKEVIFSDFAVVEQ